MIDMTPLHVSWLKTIRLVKIDLFFDAFLLAAQCRREHGIDVGAAAHAAAAKVKRRCPHVFGNEVATTAAEAAAIWQRVKREEKRLPAARQ